MGRCWRGWGRQPASSTQLLHPSSPCEGSKPERFQRIQVPSELWYISLFNVSHCSNSWTNERLHIRNTLPPHCFLTSGIRTPETYYLEHWVQWAHWPLQTLEGEGHQWETNPHSATKTTEKEIVFKPHKRKLTKKQGSGEDCPLLDWLWHVAKETRI